MHKVTMYPLGNADSILIDLENGKKLLFDYADMRNYSDTTDKRIDLPTELRANLKAARRDNFDVVAISHLDDDHIRGASEFFHLNHAAKYQGEGRIKISELWVPAAVIIEEIGDKECDEEKRIVQREARERFKKKVGIRVFSGPQRLCDWMKKNNLDYEEYQRLDLIVNAGQMVPGYKNRKSDGVEFFVHSPFAHVQNQQANVIRNDDCLVIHATFHTPGHYGGQDTRLLLSSDVRCEVIAEIVNLTRSKGNQERLKWDILKLPHHCSYRSLAPSGQKGDTETIPIDEVKWLFEQGEKGGRIVSTSEPVCWEDQIQPPHFQAANAHKRRANAIGGEFLVTMEHPSKHKPEPLVFKIDNCGATLEKRTVGGAIAITSAPALRAGSR